MLSANLLFYYFIYPIYPIYFICGRSWVHHDMDATRTRPKALWELVSANLDPEIFNKTPCVVLMYS